MSFLKNFTKEFDTLKAKFTDEDNAPPKPSEASRGEADSFYGSQVHGSTSQSGPPQAPGGYQTGGPPPVVGVPPGAPSSPPGWEPRWDENSQRWYYFEHATGRTQWDSPALSVAGNNPPYGGPQSGGYGGDARGHGGAPVYGNGPSGHAGAPAGAQAYGLGPPGYGHAAGQQQQAPGKSSAMMYGAGGLAVGENDSSHSQGYSQQSQQQGQSYDPGSQQSYSAPPPQDDGMPPAVLPATDADGDSVSSSDREEVQGARADYEGELANASPGSSGDEEDVQEAREEYEEAYEETYDD